jgi:hypothetical protein
MEEELERDAAGNVIPLLTEDGRSANWVAEVPTKD